MTYFQRGILAVACILLGYFFWPLFILGGFIAWSVYSDMIDAPARRKQAEEIKARINAPVSIDDIRFRCESPAETAFLDAMISAYSLQAGPGGIEGQGLRLRNQVSMGNLRILSGIASSQYRADFLIDEKLVVEIDGAEYHSSPDALARDQRRDADMERDGYVVLRLPARIVIADYREALRRVEDARRSILPLP